jgi:ferredoxin
MTAKVAFQKSQKFQSQKFLLTSSNASAILHTIFWWMGKKGGENMKVRVDKETCVGDETCVEVCPEVFEMQGDVAVAKTENVPKDLEEKVKEAATSCPVEAILIE